MTLNFAFIAFEEEKSGSASLRAIFMNRLRESRCRVEGPRCSRRRSAQVRGGAQKMNNVLIDDSRIAWTFPNRSQDLVALRCNMGFSCCQTAGEAPERFVR